MAPAKLKKTAPSKAQKKQAPTARVVPNLLPHPPLADTWFRLPRHIIQDVCVPASAKEDQKYRNDVSRFYDGVLDRLVEELEQELVEDVRPPGHPDVVNKAAFLEKGKELVAELKS